MSRMLYFANASAPAVRAAMAAGELGMMCTPAEGRSPQLAKAWAADNGCFGRGYPGDTKWLRWLTKLTPYSTTCAFATAPDVFDPDTGQGNAAATLERSAPWLPVIAQLGYPPALVAQDGLEDLTVPWHTFSVLFLGGSTRWKLSDAAATLTAEAIHRGKTVHMGRVNTRGRWRYAEHIGCTSADGTFLAYGPDTNLRRLRKWTDQPSLFTSAGKES